MNKEIAISIRPEWVEKILNGEKIIEIRKRFPKDFKGKVYIYVTKGTPLYLTGGSYDDFSYSDSYESYVCDEAYYDYDYWSSAITPDDFLNGKVVASFIVDAVVELHPHYDTINNDLYYKADYLFEDDIEYGACLSHKELVKYIGNKEVFYAIHISNLEIFDKPKELSDFGIKKAPQSWMYVRGK